MKDEHVNDAAKSVVEDVPQDVAQDLVGFGARAARALLATPPPPPPCLCAVRAEMGAQLGSSVAFGSGCGQTLPGVPRKAPLCLFPTIDRHLRTSVAVLHALPVFHLVSSSSLILLLAAHRCQSPWATCDCQALVDEHDELCLFRTIWRTKADAEASLPRVPLHLHHVFFYARAPNCRNSRAASGRSWPLFVPW